MKKNRLVLSDAAAAGIVEQADWYQMQSGHDLAKRWEDAVTSALIRVLSHPATGPPCKFRSGELRKLRRPDIPGFRKHLLFYTFDSNEVFIIRVVHGSRDLERLL